MVDITKKHKLWMLYDEAPFDLFIQKFMDFSSDKMLDEKIEVLEAIIAGKAPSEIPNYYKVLENYPDNHPDNHPEDLWDPF